MNPPDRYLCSSDFPLRSFHDVSFIFRLQPILFPYDMNQSGRILTSGGVSIGCWRRRELPDRTPEQGMVDR